MLKGAQEKAAKAGVPLDVGEFPSAAETDTEPEDPQRIIKLTAHAVARMADRFTLIRRLSRHMEGQEKRAGIISDVAAVAYSVYKRNPGAVEHLARQFANDLQVQRAARQAPTNGGAVHQTEGVGNAQA